MRARNRESGGAMLEIGSIVSVIAGDRRTDQPACLECDDRGGEGGRQRPRLCHVAEEVKSLAGQTAKETDGIEKKISKHSERGGSTVESVSAFPALRRNRGRRRGNRVAVERQSATARDITTNVGEAGKTTQASPTC